MLAHLQAVIETNRGKIVVCRHLPMMLMKLLGINIAFLLSLHLSFFTFENNNRTYSFFFYFFGFYCFVCRLLWLSVYTVHIFTYKHTSVNFVLKNNWSKAFQHIKNNIFPKTAQLQRKFITKTIHIHISKQQLYYIYIIYTSPNISYSNSRKYFELDRIHTQSSWYWWNRIPASIQSPR